MTLKEALGVVNGIAWASIASTNSKIRIALIILSRKLLSFPVGARHPPQLMICHVTPPDELFLIDGNSLAYRAFFALPDTIATSEGQPTNAIFGFASMLVKILTEYGPKATIVVWDAGMSGREEEYEPYKAERKPRPDLLREQWPHLEPLVEAFGYRNVRIEGYEADDVIASLAERAKEEGIDVMVVTGDRDAYQLPDDGRVKVMTTSRGITDTRIYDREGVIERYGVPPESVPDFIGLKGDTSDNIPGVPGIGDKTAAQLLQKYGSLEEVLSHIEEISGKKRQENLRENRDLAIVSKQLATLKRDIETGVDVTRDRRRAARPLTPARRVPPIRVARPPAPARGGARRRGCRAEAPGGRPARGTAARAASEADLATLRDGPGRAGGGARGEGRSLGGSGWRARCWSDESKSLPALLEAWGERPLIARDWKETSRATAPDPGGSDSARGLPCPGRAAPRHDGGRLPDQPGASAATRWKSCWRRRVSRCELEGEARRRSPTRPPRWARSPSFSASEIERLGLRRLLEEVELPLVEVLCWLERAGREARHGSARAR